MLYASLDSGSRHAQVPRRLSHLISESNDPPAIEEFAVARTGEEGVGRLAAGARLLIARTGEEIEMIGVGQKAPEFTGTLGGGGQFRLKDYRGRRHVVLYFFPKDFTPGCTKEACSFRDRRPEITALDAEIVGVSLDTAEKHEEFAAAHNLPYPLISDRDAKIAAAYGVARLGGWLPTKRVTFVIDKQGVVQKVIKSELGIDLHIDDALATLRELSGK
jgi:peroxiredoxin Q/BCP